jgi:hypothetical protein
MITKITFNNCSRELKNENKKVGMLIVITKITKIFTLLSSLLTLKIMINRPLNQMITKITKYSITKGICMLYSINRVYTRV